MNILKFKLPIRNVRGVAQTNPDNAPISSAKCFREIVLKTKLKKNTMPTTLPLGFTLPR
jgi:hypothetical protein